MLWFACYLAEAAEVEDRSSLQNGECCSTLTGEKKKRKQSSTVLSLDRALAAPFQWNRTAATGSHWSAGLLYSSPTNEQPAREASRGSLRAARLLPCCWCLLICEVERNENPSAAFWSQVTNEQQLLNKSKALTMTAFTILRYIHCPPILLRKHDYWPFLSSSVPPEAFLKGWPPQGFLSTWRKRPLLSLQTLLASVRLMHVR